MCVGKLTIIGSDNGLLPGRYQAIIWTNAGILLIGPLRTYFNEMLIEIQTLSVICCPFRRGLNVLKAWRSNHMHCFLWDLTRCGPVVSYGDGI